MEVFPHAICSDVELLAKCCCAAKFLLARKDDGKSHRGKKIPSNISKYTKPTTVTELIMVGTGRI